MGGFRAELPCKLVSEMFDWKNKPVSAIAEYIMDCSPGREPTEQDIHESVRFTIECRNDPVLRAKATAGLLQVAKSDDLMRAHNAVDLLQIVSEKNAEHELLALFRSRFPKKTIKCLVAISKGITMEGILLTSILNTLTALGSARGLKLARASRKVFANTTLGALIWLRPPSEEDLPTRRGRLEHIAHLKSLFKKQP